LRKNKGWKKTPIAREKKRYSITASRGPEKGRVGPPHSHLLGKGGILFLRGKRKGDNSPEPEGRKKKGASKKKKGLLSYD